MPENEKGRPTEGSPIPNAVPWQDNSVSKPKLSAIQACPHAALTNTAEMRINKRERFKTELDQRHGKPVVRIVRLRPTASGDMRPAGGSLEFAAKHLPGVIAMLQELNENGAAND